MAGDVIGLHWADYVVTVLCLLVSLGIGVFFALFRGGQKTKEAYLVGNRAMSLGPVCLSLFITFQSAISLIGIPADACNTGTMVVFNYVGLPLGTLVSFFTVLPLVHPLRLTSVYQYLALRFRSNFLRLLVTIIAMVQTFLYMGLTLYSPALVLEAVVGLPLWMSVIVVGVVGTFYTSIGGFKSVIWTDVFQTIIVFIGIISVLIKGIIYVGGFSQMMDIAAEGGRLIFDEVDLRSRHSYWSTISGTCIFWMVNMVSQSTVQRISSLPHLSQAKRCFLLNIPLYVLYGVTLTLMGVLMYSYFVITGCDPYDRGFITNKNQMAPYFVMHVFRDLPGMSGLYMSMLFSGSLSTLSSGINALAANTVEDLFAGPLQGVKDTTVTIIAKITVAVLGCFIFGLAYLMQYVPGPVSQIAISVVGAFGSPVMAIFFLAAGFPRSNTIGAVGGIVVGSAVTVTLILGSIVHGAPIASLPPGPTDRCDVSSTSWTSPAMWNMTSATPMTLGAKGNLTTTSPPVYSDFRLWDISYMWIPVIAFFTTIITGVIISLITGIWKEAEKVDSRLLFPFCRKLYGFPDPEDAPGETISLPLKTDHEATQAREEQMDESSYFI